MSETNEIVRVVKKEETRPCGCHVTTYSDDTAVLSPCPPCGMMDVAQSLGRASQALGAVASRLRSERNAIRQQEASEALQRAVQQGRTLR
jgi:hypothetical protein